MRLIDGDELREKWSKIRLDDLVYCANDFLDSIKNAPTVDPVKHGKWVTGYPITCSVCGKPAFQISDTWEKYEAQITDFCPYCGAKMDLED